MNDLHVFDWEGNKCKHFENVSILRHRTCSSQNKENFQSPGLLTNVIHLGHIHASHHVVDKCAKFLSRLLDGCQATKDGDAIVATVAGIARGEREGKEKEREREQGRSSATRQPTQLKVGPQKK